MATHSDKPFAEQCKLCEQEAIAVSMGNLMTFPFVKQPVIDKKLSIHGWYFDMEEGELIKQ